MSREQEVLDKLSAIMDPDLGRDIVSLGFVKDLQIADGRVSFKVELTTPACPIKERFRQQSEQLVRELPWVKEVAVQMTAQPRRNPQATQAESGLRQVRHIVAVASCKGGVGKSTVAVNLAFTLAAQGARVGIFDADVYGPSLMTMVQAEFSGLYQREGLIQPVEAHGLKLMSFAYVTAPQGGGPAVMRGPMVASVIQQLLLQTEWGELDYLVIDMPPGTGDVQLTLSQIIPISAAVIVTTPQEISFIDVEKGIQMFDKLRVPVVSVVENMCYFVCDQCEKKHYLFGRGAKDRLVNQFGIRNSVEIPIEPKLAAHSDAGLPLVQAEPAGAVAKLYRELGEAVVREISVLANQGRPHPDVEYEKGRGLFLKWADGREQELSPAKVRRQCRCAHCVEEFSGKQLLRPEDVAEDVAPTAIDSMGNYAVSIGWSDGHHSIFPYELLEKLA